MNLVRRSARPLALVAGALCMASGTSAAPAGQIPNELTDRLIVAPLKASNSIWDVFQVLNNWLSETYPKSGDARQAIDTFGKFIAEKNPGAAKGKAAPRTIEMPMGVDTYLKLLRKEAPGLKGRALPEALAGNPKAQLATALLLPFLQMRGIVYRIRPLAATSFIIHSEMVNRLRALKQDLRVRSGTNGLAIFEFLTYPLADAPRETTQFTRISELQAWIQTCLIPTLDVSIELAEGALKTMKRDQKESIDLTVFMKADDPFPDATMELASRTFTASEVKLMIARAYFDRARLRIFSAYELDDLPAVSNSLRNNMMQAFFKEKIPFAKIKEKPRVGTPPMVRYEITRKFPKFLTLKDGGQGPAALADLRSAWRSFDGGMKELYGSSDRGADRMVDLVGLQATERDYHDKIAPQIAAVLGGRASITDYVGGAVVDIDLPGFVASLPSDLKSFFPSAFDRSDAYWTFDFSSGPVTYTNYDFGTPVGWDPGAAGDSWTKLFPNMRSATNAAGQWDGPLWTMRDFSRTYVGRILAPMLAPVVY